MLKMLKMLTHDAGGKWKGVKMDRHGCESAEKAEERDGKW